MNDEAFTTLHRHWVWCQVIKENYDRELHFRRGEIGLTSERWELLATRYGAFKSLWYGLLFSILETLEKNKVVIGGIEEEISSVYKPLKRYRHAVFHPQPKYWSEKLFEISKDKNSAKKILKVHEALRGYFCEELSKRKPAPGSTYQYEMI